MRLLKYAVSVLIATLMLFVAPAYSIETSPPSPLLPQSPLIITAYSVGQDGVPHYIEIYNNSSTVQSVAEWSVALEWGARTGASSVTPVFSTQLASNNSGFITPGGYTIVSFNDVVPGAHVQVSGIAVESLNYVSKLSLQHANYRPYDRVMTASMTQTPMRLNRGASGYVTTYGAEDRETLWMTEWYAAPETTPLRVVEMLPNSDVCQPFDASAACADYVKLYNNSDTAIDLSTVRIRTGTASTMAALEGLLPGRAYVSAPINLTNSGGWVWLEDSYGIVRYESTMVAYGDSASKRGQAWSLDSSTAQWRWTAYPTPYDTPNQFTDGSPVNECSALRLSEIAANTNRQFIEVYNASAEPASVRGCQLQTNRSQEVSYVFDDRMVQPGEFVVVEIAHTSLTLTKTTSGTVYLISSDGQSEVDARSYENMSENTSLALVDGVWRTTFAITPGQVNHYQEYPACAEGYVRNPTTKRCNKITASTSPVDCGPGRYRSAETGRCRNIASATSQVPCRADQYRNPETNRCRNLTSTSSTLTPCKPGQERNPATNRCRAMATSASSLKPCAAGQERNPATNRCRKVASGDAQAGFKVVDTDEVKDRAASWLALAGVSVLALGYAAWEWRREVYGALVKVFDALPFGK